MLAGEGELQAVDAGSAPGVLGRPLTQEPGAFLEQRLLALVVVPVLEDGFEGRLLAGEQ